MNRKITTRHISVQGFPGFRGALWAVMISAIVGVAGCSGGLGGVHQSGSSIVTILDGENPGGINEVASPAGAASLESGRGATDATGAYHASSAVLGKNIEVVATGAQGLPLTGLEVAWCSRKNELGLLVRDPSGVYPPVLYQGDPVALESSSISSSQTAPSNAPKASRNIEVGATSLRIALSLFSRTELPSLPESRMFQMEAHSNYASIAENHALAIVRTRDLGTYLGARFSSGAVLGTVTEDLAGTPVTLTPSTTAIPRMVTLFDSMQVADGGFEATLERMAANNWGRPLSSIDFVFVRSGTMRLGSVTGFFEIFPRAIDDMYEENDTLATAKIIRAGFHPGLLSLPGDEDWFKIFGNAGSSFEVTIRYASVHGDIDLELFGPTGSLIATSNSTGDVDAVRTGPIPVAGAGYYYIKISQKSVMLCPNPYDMSVAVSYAPCFDPDDLASTLQWSRPMPVESATGVTDALGSFRKRSEAFRRDIAVSLRNAQGSPLSGLEVAWCFVDGDLGMFIYDPAGVYPSAFFQGDPYELPPDTVMRSPGFSAPDAPRRIIIVPDEMSITMTLRTAAELAGSLSGDQLQKAEFRNITSASSDYEWKVLRSRDLPAFLRERHPAGWSLVSAGTQMEFPPAEVTQASGPVAREAIVLELRRLTNGGLAERLARLEKMSWGRSAEPDETVIVRASTVSLGRLSSVVEIFPNSIDDSYESNDTMAEAKEIRAGDTAGLVSIAGNDDWFKFYNNARTYIYGVLSSSDPSNLDLYVYDSKGINIFGPTPLFEMSGQTSQEYLYIKVCRKNDFGCPIRYSLNLSETLRPCSDQNLTSSVYISPDGFLALEHDTGVTDAAGMYSSRSIDLGKDILLSLVDRTGNPIPGLDVAWSCRHGILGLFVEDPNQFFPPAFYLGPPEEAPATTILQSPSRQLYPSSAPHRLISTPRTLEITLTLSSRVELGALIAPYQLQKAEFDNAASVSQKYVWSALRTKDVPGYLKDKFSGTLSLLSFNNSMMTPPTTVSPTGGKVSKETYALDFGNLTHDEVSTLVQHLRGLNPAFSNSPNEILYLRESSVVLGRLVRIIDVFPYWVLHPLDQTNPSQDWKELHSGEYYSLVREYLWGGVDKFRFFGNSGSTVEITLSWPNEHKNVYLDVFNSMNELVVSASSEVVSSRTISFHIPEGLGDYYYFHVYNFENIYPQYEPEYSVYNLRIDEQFLPCGDPKNPGNDILSPTGNTPVDFAGALTDAAGVYMAHSTALGMDLEVTTVDEAGTPIPGLRVDWACRDGLLAMFVSDPSGIHPPAYYQGNPFDVRPDTVLQSPAKERPIHAPSRIITTPTAIRITLTLRTAVELGAALSAGQLQKAEFENLAAVSEFYAWSVHRARDLPSYLKWRYPNAEILFAVGNAMTLAPTTVFSGAPAIQETYRVNTSSSSATDITALLSRMGQRAWGLSVEPFQVVFLRETSPGLAGLAGVVEVFPRAIDDAYEENDSAAEAKVIDVGLHSSLVSIPTDEDWFKFYGHINSTFEVELRHASSRGDLDLTLYGPSGAVIGESAGNGDIERVSVDSLISAADTGYYLVKVSRKMPGGCPVPYDLKVISHVIPPADNRMLRIVLNWGTDPVDLDSHLWLTSPTGEILQVDWTRMGTLADQPYATLDIDRVTADLIGRPETITVFPIQATVYTYTVHHFSGDKTLSDSEATVHVYRGDRLVRSYSVPTTGAYGPGSYWNVFTFDGATGRFSEVNQFDPTPPYAWSPGRMPAKPSPARLGN